MSWPQSVSQDDFFVEHKARERLQHGFPYAHFFREIKCECADGVLTLTGSVPTFYLKQILQTRLMDVHGVAEIHNQVDVISPTGLSSVHEYGSHTG